VSDSALVQELTSTRAALRQAIALGEKIQARNDAALAIARKWAESPSVRELIAALEGKS
jgi:hypothetical protein